MFGWLSKTINAMSSNKGIKIDKPTLENMLLESDVSYEVIEEILEQLPSKKDVSKDSLKEILNSYFIYNTKENNEIDTPFVDLIIGINGAGKTTTTAKLANLYKKNGKKVLLGACDTFRAGAIEQLKL